MATLSCLACGHENNTGRESCASCSSPLSMKLCSACEAINADRAGRCHGCGAYFATAAGVVEPRPPERVLTSSWVMSGEPVWRSRGFRAAVWTLSLVATAGATSYYFFSRIPGARAMTVAVPAPAVERKTVPPAVEPVVPQVTHTRRSDDSAAAGGATTPVGAAVPAKQEAR